MFDYHLHSSLSFDSETMPMEIALAAKENGLREICFTDHYDYNSDPEKMHNLFSHDAYRAAYDGLELPGLAIRKGVEAGLTRWNEPQLNAFLEGYPFDFVIGSVHFVDGYDPYEPEYWQGRTVQEAFRVYLEEIYHCVRIHENFDVLGHLTYVCKSVSRAGTDEGFSGNHRRNYEDPGNEGQRYGNQYQRRGPGRCIPAIGGLSAAIQGTGR